MVTIIVVNDFETQKTGELNLRVGEVITNARQTDQEGWWYGELDGKWGRFPSKFIKEIPSRFLGDTSQTQPRSVRSKNREKRRRQRWCEVIFSYTAERPDELQLTMGDIIEVLGELEDGWWLGRKNEKSGAFPSNFVIELQHSDGYSRKGPPKEPGDETIKRCPRLSDSSLELKQPSEIQAFRSMRLKAGRATAVVANRMEKEYCKVIFDYIGTSEDELELHRGDVILVLNKDTGEDGWWEGYLNGKEGLFPDNFVTFYSQTPEATEGIPSKFQPTNYTSLTPDSLEVAKKPELPIWKSEHKDDQTEAQNEKPEAVTPANFTPAKKVPPPVKIKPTLFNFPNKANAEQPGPPQTRNETQRDKIEPELMSFDILTVSTEKLSHPTANRAKPQGRRPPSQLVTHLELPEPPPQVPVKPAPLPAKASAPVPKVPFPTVPPLCPPVLRPSSGLPSVPEQASRGKGEGTLAAIQELRGEIHSLHLSLDLLRNQHQKDMTELKQEMVEERNKRTVLQMEVDRMRKLMAST
ncbi:SH3 domain-containing protein 21 isoform X3 [Callorhinchus milii]|uniref:SH3 domain-containing protein 21 isoform X3 n=1 Tax=Callorhinchus milii TaxID=7868 RepID=UPI0004571E92|nr:SH3 domain-containing protein 21 isoform X3 [Callorhinchus milii]|eukprot:gi/632976737/ref/XP_007904962.1/ PREDICTED: SH3 domain-containing protein 21 isoform X1 [Callorhinchus milii]